MKKVKKILLYGEISEWGENSARRFMERFNEAAKDASEIHLHIHSPGGSVFEGIVIYNLIKSSKVPVYGYVDGICASMAVDVFMACKKRYMCRNSFTMTHSAYTCICGNADDLRKAAVLLEEIELEFKKVLADITGKTPEELSAWFVGDNWFSARMAHDNKLIDGIVEPVELENIEYSNDNANTLYMKYKTLNKLCNSVNINNISKIGEMDKQSLIKKFALEGVTADSTDQEVESAIQAKLDAEKTARENIEKTVADAKKARIVDMVTAAIKEGKVSETARAQFETIGNTAGEEVLKTALDAIKNQVKIADMLGSSSGSSRAQIGRDEWTFDQWQKEDPKGLEALPYEKLNALYKAKFGTEAPKQ